MMQSFNPRIASLVLGACAVSLAGASSAWAQPELETSPPSATDTNPSEGDEAPAPDAEPFEETPPPATAAPEAPTPEPAPVVEPAASTAEPETVEATPPKALAIGKKANGTFVPGALLQFWTTYSTYSAEEADPDYAFGYRVRRGEIKLGGDIVPERVSYGVMIDIAKAPRFSSASLTDSNGDTLSVVQPNGSDQSMLQDYSITFITDYADISVGQFKNPVSLEGLGSSARLLFPERSDVARAYGDRRDLGLKIAKKLGDHFYYYAGLFSGSGLNTADVDNDKDAGLRLEVYPIKGLTLGAVGYATIGSRDELTRDRVEADVRVDIDGFFAQTEYIRAWDAPAGGAAVEGHGAFLGLGYTIDQLQPIARVAFLDRNVDADDDTLTKYEVGLNYFIQDHEAKLSFSASYTDWEEPDVAGRTDLDLILAAQVSF